MKLAIAYDKKADISFDSAVSYLAGAGTMILGFAAVHNGLKLINMQDSALANAGVSVAAVVGAMLVPNPWVKIGLIAVAAFAGTKALVLATKEVTAPTAGLAGGVTGFIAGLIPDSVKAHINSFLPSLGNSDYDSLNYAGDGYSGTGEINLDEPINGPESLMNIGNDNDEMEGLGDLHPAM